MSSFKSYSFKVAAAFLILTAGAWVVVNRNAQARPPEASRINVQMLDGRECGFTQISGRSCIYCLPNGYGAPSLSCDFRSQP